MIVSTLSYLSCIGIDSKTRYFESADGKLCQYILLSIQCQCRPFSRPTGPPEPAPPAGRPRPRPGHRQRALQARQEAGPEGGAAQARERMGSQIRFLINYFILIVSNRMRSQIWLYDCIRKKREQRPVQIFNDKDYLKAIKVRITSRPTIFST